MKIYSLLAVVVALGFSLATGDADAARRFGGGKSSGMQRQATAPDKSTSAAPSATKAQPAAATPQAQPRRSWMGPLAGLAAGLGLAALASHFGMGEQFASMLMMGLLVVAVLMAISYFKRRSAAAHQPRAAGMQYAAVGAGSAPAQRGAYDLSLPASGSAAPVAGSNVTPIAAAGNIPADFDVAGFVRNAKVGFIRLQAANDAGDLDDIREFTSPEMFAEIKMNIVERGSAKQETDVVNLDAELIEVAEEETRYIASVRFSGLIKEEQDAVPEPFTEIWHVARPLDGKRGWILMGIQQTQQ